MTPNDKTFFGMKIDNHISAGHILTTVCLVVSGITWAVNTDNRLQHLERQDLIFAQESQDFKKDYRDDMREIRVLFQQISDKIDKKMDRGQR